MPRALPKQMLQYFGVPGGMLAPIQITFGAASVVASFKGPYLVNAVKSGTGQITLTFDRSMRSFMGVMGSWWKLAGATAALTANSTAASLDGAGTTASSNTMIIETKSGATPTDPGTGDILFLWPVWNETQVL